MNLTQIVFDIKVDPLLYKIQEMAQKDKSLAKSVLAMASEGILVECKFVRSFITIHLTDAAMRLLYKKSGV